MDLNTLSEANAVPSGASVPVKGAKPEPEAKPYEPMVHGESSYDRVSSMLMSCVIGASIIVAWLWLINYTNSAYAAKTPPPVTLIEVYGDGTSGAPDGDTKGQGDSVDNGAPAGAQAATGSSEDASSFEEPAPQATTSATLDAFATATDAPVEGGEVMAENNVGGAVAGGRKASFKGNGIKGMGTGTGNGPGGASRENRWVFEFAPGQGEDEYARMLDFFGVELATPAGSNTLAYASGFQGAPVTHTGLTRQEARIYFSWSSPARKRFDVQLLAKAGIKADASSIIIQFFSKKFEDKIAQTEYNFKGRQPGEIRKTRFKIIGSGSSFDVQVLSQDPWK